MSGRLRVFHGIVFGVERSREPLPRTVEANARRVPGAAKHARNLVQVEPFPADEREQLAIPRAQTGESRSDGARRVRVRAEGCARGFVDQAAAETRAPSFRALVVRQYAPRRPVEPESRFVAL